jgi:hypothetical protein
MNQCHYALVSRSLGEFGQLVAGFLADTETALAAESDEAFEPYIIAFTGHQNVIEAPPSSLERFLNRMQPVQNFHEE